MFLTRLNLLSNSPHTKWICFWSLQKSTISTKNIAHTILRRSVKLWDKISMYLALISTLHTLGGKYDRIIRARRISQAKNFG